MEEKNENENIENKNNLKVYNIEDLDLKQGSFTVIVSKRCSGKSVIMRNIVKHLLDIHDYDVILMFSETCQFNNDWSFLDKNLIFKTLDMENKIEKILKIQEKNIKKNKKINILVLCDDVIVHSRSKQLINLSTMSRHFNITVICSVQYCKGLCSSSIRNNIDYFLWSQLGEIALKSVYESIHVDMNFKKFNEFVQKYNENYQFILYDSRTQDRKQRLKIIRGRELTNLKLLNK